MIAQFADDIAHGRSPGSMVMAPTRDVTHVDNIVRGLKLATDHGLTGIYNLGTGEAYNFETVVEMINEELGTDVKPEYVENPIPESVYVYNTCVDYSKIQEETGWEPEIEFRKGIHCICLRD